MPTKMVVSSVSLLVDQNSVSYLALTRTQRLPLLCKPRGNCHGGLASIITGLPPLHGEHGVPCQGLDWLTVVLDLWFPADNGAAADAPQPASGPVGSINLHRGVALDPGLVSRLVGETVLSCCGVQTLEG